MIRKEREGEGEGGDEKNYILKEGQKQYPVLQVPSRCPLVLVVEVRLL
jgi:hypothetical protein